MQVVLSWRATPIHRDKRAATAGIPPLDQYLNWFIDLAPSALSEKSPQSVNFDCQSQALTACPNGATYSLPRVQR
jgi:hypothetical protein